MDAAAVYCDTVCAFGESLPEDPEYWRAGHTLDYSSSTNSLLLFGGYEGPQELWILNNASSVTSTEVVEASWSKHTIDCHGRAGHVSAINGNKLLIYGGYSKRGVLGDVFEIDTTDFSCKEIACQGVMYNRERRWHTACMLGNRWIIHGGWNNSGPLGNVMSLNLESQIWEEVAMQGDSMPGSRRWHTMTPLNGNQLMIAGGYNGDYFHPLADAWKMDIETQQWMEIKPKGTAPGMRHRHSMTDLGNKMLLMVGGHDQRRQIAHDVFIFHKDTESWSQVTSCGGLHDIQRCAHRSVLAGNAYIASGGYKKTYISTFSYFDIRMLKAT